MPPPPRTAALWEDEKVLAAGCTVRRTHFVPLSAPMETLTVKLTLSVFCHS